MRNPWEWLMHLFVAADVWLFAASQRVENFHAHLLERTTING